MSEQESEITIDDAPPVSGSILVCVDASPSAARLVRTAFRLADKAGVPWTALHVERPGEDGVDGPAQERLSRAMALAESLGAKVVNITGGRGLAREIVEFAQTRRFGRIVLGRSSRARWRRRVQGNLAEAVLRLGGELELTLVPTAELPSSGKAKDGPGRKRPAFDPMPYLWALAATAIAGLLAFSVEHAVPLANLSLLFLTAVLVIGGRFGTKPALFAAAASVAVYNFFFTEPYYTFSVDYRSDVLTLLFFLAAAVVAGNLAGRFRTQLEHVQQSARRNAVLYDFSRRVAAASGLDDVLWAVCHHVAVAFEARSLVLLPEEAAPETLAIKAGYPPQDELSEADWMAAHSAWREGRTAGFGSTEFAGAEHLFIPMWTRRGSIGLIGVAFKDVGWRGLRAETQRLLEAVASQSAIAIERARLAHDLEQARVRSETESLRSALLSSISHDLRTPLVSVIGSATTLKLLGDEVGLPDRLELVDTILEEAQRLNRFLQNLLDMTRLGFGALTPRRDWADLREVVGVAIHDLREPLARLEVKVELADDVPLLFLDPVLMEHVFVNLLDNASKFSPDAGTIVVHGRRVDDAVEIGVVDQGPGVPEAERELVFDMFYRGRSGDQAEGGTGLGLAICKGLVEAHGGRIRAEAGPGGRGTAMLIRLPIDRTPPAGPADEEDQ